MHKTIAITKAEFHGEKEIRKKQSVVLRSQLLTACAAFTINVSGAIQLVRSTRLLSLENGC